MGQTVNSAIENSGLPFMIGCRDTFSNFIQQDPFRPPVSYDKPYRGILREIKLSHRRMDENRIKEEWRLIQQRISDNNLLN